MLDAVGLVDLSGVDSSTLVDESIDVNSSIVTLSHTQLVRVVVDQSDVDDDNNDDDYDNDDDGDNDDDDYQVDNE